MLVIGINGKIDCGKSTLARILRENCLPSGTETLSFGDPIKQETAKEFEFNAELCYTDAGKKTKIIVPNKYRKYFRDVDCTVRDAIQFYGTDFVRRQNPNYWTDKARVKLNRFSEECPCVVCDDLRTMEEAWLLRQYPAFLIRLEPYDGYVNPPGNAHRIERELDEYCDWNLRFAPKFGSLHHAALGIQHLLNSSLLGPRVAGVA